MKIRTLGLLLLAWLMMGGALAVAQDNASLTVQGRIVQGTSDGNPLPANLPIELQIVDVDIARSSFSQTVLSQADGSFIFENVPQVDDRDFYLLYATYAGVKQRSQPLYANQVNFVSFPLYETTTALDAVEIISGVMQINRFALLQGSGVNLEVVMKLQVMNRGDRIVYDPAAAIPHAMRFELPAGAYGVNEVMVEGETLKTLAIEDGAIPLVYDLLPLNPLWPRAREIWVTYLLPYGQAAIIDEPFPALLNNFEVWVPQDEVYLSSEVLSATDQTVSVASDLPPYVVYEQNRPLAAGESLVFTLQGSPINSLQQTPAQLAYASDKDSSSTVLLVVGIAGVLILLSGIWVFNRRQALATMDIE